MSQFQFNPKHISFIQKTFTSSFKFRMMLLQKIPMNYLAGIRVRELTEDRCEVTVKHKWLNQNPFRSTFWAVLGMAAELASGALATMFTFKQQPSIAMLVVGQTGKFYKKAVGRTTFVCETGQEIKAAIQKAADTGEPVEITCPTFGYNDAKELICEFTFTWSLKARKNG